MSWGHVKPTQRGKPKTTNASTAWCRGRCPTQGRSAIQYEDAGKRANLHLQTSQPQTKGHADRSDAHRRKQNKQKDQDNQQDQTQKQTKGGKGKPARQRGDQTHKRRQRQNRKPQRPTTEAEGKEKAMTTD